MSRTIRAAICLSLLLAWTARADVVVPNSAAGVEADGVFSLTSTATAGRTYQFTIDSGQLTGLVGQNIVGLQWRLNGASTAAWPPANTTYAFWDVFVGPGVDPSAMTTTFATNFTAAPTQVRSGPLAITAGTFPFGGSPNAFGPALDFTTPFLYTGGDLAIEMRFAQQVGSTTQSPFDGVLASGGPANGWGVDFSSRFATNSTATTGTNANFLVTNLVVPEPASIALIGIASAVALRRKPR
jgi:hypothetical protein